MKTGPAAPTAAALLVLAASWANASTTLTLDRAFVEANKDRATIEGTFLVDFAHDSPKPAKEDADIHIAGPSAEVGVIGRAEIMNSQKWLGVDQLT